MEKGITLIALIITIVVLLILAIVSIGAIRNSKIITHSQDASNDHITGQEKEKIQLALSEWQIQKNAPGNTQNFKNVIETELSDSATISGNANELTIKFNKTGNTYKILPDGTIREPVKLTGTPLEKYIFGEDLKGRDISEIFNMSNGTFTDTNVQFVTYGADDIISDVEILCALYIKNGNIIYKFNVIYNFYENTFTTTQPYYGLTKIEVAGERVGKTVSYDEKTWTILYDDDTNGLQMISNEVYDNFYLGYNDSSITNWNSLITTADLDGNGSLNDFEKSIYSYNNAITTLNTACENLFKENGIYKNNNIVDVRCVGSNPTSKNSENATPYTSENLAKWPENNSTYSLGIGNGKGKSTDLNYVTDLDRMVALGTHIGYNSSNEGEDYWLASRLVGEYSSDVVFAVRYVEVIGRLSGIGLWYVLDSDTSCYYSYNALRPVVSLSSNVQLQETESGSATDYVLN